MAYEDDYDDDGYDEDSEIDSNQNREQKPSKTFENVSKIAANRQKIKTNNESGGSTVSNAAKSLFARSEKGQQLAENVEKAKNAIDMGRRVGQATQWVARGVQSLVASLMNPITWVFTVVAIVVVLALAAMPLIGHNENADGCITNGVSDGGGIAPAATGDAAANMNALGNWLMTNNFKFLGNKPMTKLQAAAFAGNAERESGYDPHKQQGGAESSISNQDLLNLGSGYNNAFGFFQWDGVLRQGLAKFATSKNTPWYDYKTQLGFMQDMVDNQGIGATMVQHGFNDPSKTVDDLTGMVNEYFEVSADRPSECASNGSCAANQERINNAKKFLQTYQGGAGVTTGGSCLAQDGNSSADMSSVVNLATSIAYQPGQRALALVKDGDIDGVSVAPQAYKDAKASAEKKGGMDTEDPNLYASCDRFIATVIKNTVDVNIPWGSTTEQYNYLNSSPKWKRFDKKSEAKPGDIFVTIENGHITMYIGNYKGVDSLVDASHTQRVGLIYNSSYINENLQDTTARQYAGFHFVGNGGSNAAASEATSITSSSTGK